MGMFFSTRLLRTAVLSLAAPIILSGCLTAKMYIDPALPVVGKSDLSHTSQPHPVQVLFEFRTKGNANARATAELRPRVVTVVAESGLFGNVSEAPTGGDSAQLKLIIDNVVITDNAEAKGFGTGLTLGLVGSMVTDGYVCSASYTWHGKVTQTTVRHALHTTIGNHAGPPGLQPMEPQAAIHQVIDQITWNVLKNLVQQNAFE